MKDNAHGRIDRILFYGSSAAKKQADPSDLFRMDSCNKSFPVRIYLHTKRRLRKKTGILNLIRITALSLYKLQKFP